MKSKESPSSSSSSPASAAKGQRRSMSDNEEQQPQDRSTINIEDLLDSLGWDGQVGQMAQIDINMLLTDDHKELRQDLLDHYIGTLGVGSVLNNQNQFDPLWKMKDFRAAVLQVQATAQKFGRPPVIWGLDSVHGANYLYDTIITPQPINLAASFNSSLAYQAGGWASRDTRRVGIPWLFSPLLGLSWNPFWSRVYETFGEDPVLVGKMALAMTQGIQALDDETTAKTIVPSRAAACGKHFVGYSMPRDGHDRAPSWIPTRHLYQYFIPPWKQVASVIDTVMESYTEIDGVPNVANRQMLNRLLRHELDFEGLLVTDYHEIFNLFEWHHTAKDRTDAMMQSLEEGSVDMSMIANEPQDFFDTYQKLSPSISGINERVRTSARRVLELKQKLGMFEESFTMTMEDAEGPGHSPRDVALALDMTHQSIILAKNNDNVLPLESATPLRVLVTGPTANSKSFTTGGWTWQWQGADSNIEEQWFTYGSTVVEALQQQEENWQVSYSCGVDIMGRDCDSADDFEGREPDDSSGVMGKLKGWVGLNGQEPESLSVGRAMNLADSQDVIVVCVGEENYTEKPGDIRSLRLPDGQYELVAGLRQAAPEAKIVLAYFGGRPRLLADIEVRNRMIL
jgi:beta-glucosidase